MYSANQFDWNAQEELSQILEAKNKEGSYIIVTNIYDKEICKLYDKKMAGSISQLIVLM